MSWFLLRNHPQITANQVSTVGFLLGLSGCFYFIFGSKPIHSVIGSFILLLWMILDRVDGEIARFKKEESLTGSFLEGTFNFTINPLIFISLSFMVYKETLLNLAYIIGMIDSFSILIMVMIAKNNVCSRASYTRKYDLALLDFDRDETAKEHGINNTWRRVFLAVDRFFTRILWGSETISWSVFILSIIEILFHPVIKFMGLNFNYMFCFMTVYLVYIPVSIVYLIMNFYILKEIQKKYIQKHK